MPYFYCLLDVMWLLSFFLSRHVAQKQRRIIVNATSWRRIDVDTTLFLGSVPAGSPLHHGVGGWSVTFLVHTYLFSIVFFSI